MDKFDENPKEPVSQFFKSVRERATTSMGSLKDSLKGQSVQHRKTSPRLSDSKRRHRSHDRGQSWSGHSYSDTSYKLAVDRLRGMLSQVEQADGHSPGFVDFRHKRLMTGVAGPLRADIPPVEDLMYLLQSQASYIQQLEGENKCCQDELSALKSMVLEVVDENGGLHEQLKKTVVDDVVYDISPPISPNKLNSKDSINQAGKKENMRYELERIRSLHKATNERLEAQLSYVKDELKKREDLVDELRVRLRQQESSAVLAVDGLSNGVCIKCAQNEAVLAASNTGLRSGMVERLEKERDELMSSLTRIKVNLENMQQREEEACLQVKQSLELVEEAELEKTKVLVQKEQLSNELEKMRTRFEQLVTEQTEKIKQERATVRKECEHEIEQYRHRLKEAEETSASASSQLERVTREKLDSLAELDRLKNQLKVCDSDYSKTTGDLKGNASQAILERNMALEAASKAKEEVEKLTKSAKEEKSRLSGENENLHRRLKQCERELMESKEECMRVTIKVQDLDRELHQSRLSLDSMERDRADELKLVSRRAEEREDALKAVIQSVEMKHSKTVCELEEILANQSTVVDKLRDECRRQAEQLDTQASRHRSSSQQLKTQNQELNFKWEKSQKRLHQIDSELVKHGQVQERLRQQLSQMDEHAQHSSQQIIDLLAKQSQLMRDRQLLAKEVEFLRKQISLHNECDADKLYSSHKGLVDDILSDVNSTS